MNIFMTLVLLRLRLSEVWSASVCHRGALVCFLFSFCLCFASLPLGALVFLVFTFRGSGLPRFRFSGLWFAFWLLLGTQFASSSPLVAGVVFTSQVSF